MYEYQNVLDEVCFLSREDFEMHMFELEKHILQDLLFHFNKTEAESSQLIQKANLWFQVKEHPFLLQHPSFEIAYSILLQNEDKEAITFYEKNKK